MRARVYPTGDGVGRGSHIYLFRSHECGENDGLLLWPFQQRITLTLIDQSPARKDICETLLPEANTSSLYDKHQERISIQDVHS